MVLVVPNMVTTNFRHLQGGIQNFDCLWLVSFYPQIVHSLTPVRSASISVLLLIVTAIWAIIVYRNFDYGLKHHRESPSKDL
jgi:hypothetical protein